MNLCVEIFVKKLMNNELKYKTVSRSFETSQRFFLQEFSTHHDARDRQKEKEKRICTVYATVK